MPPVPLRGHSTTVRRRLALMGAALASAIALLSAITTVDASAATQPTWIVKFENQLQQAHLRRHRQGQQRHVR